MKVSVNWLRQFTDIKISIEELVEKIGAQLGAVEEVIDLGKRYQGIIISKVVSCQKHPNADKLNVCWIDDGGKAKDVERNEQGLVQVVCGAPNVREGLLVAWLPPGSTVPATFDKDPFVLGARELRGVMSNGMIASANELAISDDHSGILELNPHDAQPGDDFCITYKLDDYILDIENKMFTHRPDCFGILGVAREVAGIQQLPFTSPDIYKAPKTTGVIKKNTSLPIRISVNSPDMVPRFIAQAFTGVEVFPSPAWMQTYLSRVGIRPINNIVDLTNYYMVLTGQPLHAYDYDKLMALSVDKKSVSLETRMSRKGDKITLLNGKELTLEDDTTILITSNDVPVGVGGVMGGADTEVDENTKNIIIECANFDMYNIRRTSMKYGLFTDAVTRFNKGQSPLQNERVVAWIANQLVQTTNATPDGTVHDCESPDIKAAKKRDSMYGLIATESSFINQRLGIDLPADEIASLLRNVEFTVEVNDNVLHVTAPFWRTDIEIAEDIVEEVGRLYGYDRLPLELPRRSMSPVVPDEVLETKRQIRANLASAGANEVLTYGFVHGDLMKKAGQDADKAFRLVNAISPDLQYFRFSLTPSLLEKIHGNIKAGYDELAIFEIGRTHSKTEVDEDKLPKEFERLGLVIAKSPRATSKQLASPYYQAKYYLEQLLGKSSEGLRYVPLEGADTFNHAMFEQMLAPFEPKRSALVFHGEKKLLGVVGEYKFSVKKILKLPDYTAGFELFLTPMVSLLNQTDVYTPLSRFPKTEQDITLKVSNKVSYQDLESLIQDVLSTQENSVTSVSPISIFQKEGDESHRQITFRITVSSYVKTLKTEEVNALLDTISSQAKDKLQANRI